MFDKGEVKMQRDKTGRCTEEASIMNLPCRENEKNREGRGREGKGRGQLEASV